MTEKNAEKKVVLFELEGKHFSEDYFSPQFVKTHTVAYFLYEESALEAAKVAWGFDHKVIKRSAILRGKNEYYLLKESGETGRDMAMVFGRNWASKITKKMPKQKSIRKGAPEYMSFGQLLLAIEIILLLMRSRGWLEIKYDSRLIIHETLVMESVPDYKIVVRPSTAYTVYDAITGYIEIERNYDLKKIVEEVANAVPINLLPYLDGENRKNNFFNHSSRDFDNAFLFFRSFLIGQEELLKDQSLLLWPFANEMFTILGGHYDACFAVAKACAKGQINPEKIIRDKIPELDD